MLNIKSAISPHKNNQCRPCNCIDKIDCPLQEKCLSKNILHDADVVRKNFKRKFITAYQKQKLKQGICQIFTTNNLQQDIYHKKSFNHKKQKNDLQLSNEVWKSKGSKEQPVIKWKILGQYQPYKVNTKCNLLWLNEKLQIAIYRGNNMLSK